MSQNNRHGVRVPAEQRQNFCRTDDLAALDPDDLAALDPDDLAALDPDDLASLDPDDLAALDPRAAGPVCWPQLTCHDQDQG